MAVVTGTPTGNVEAKTPAGNSAVLRVARYTITRILTLAITVTISVYLTIMIANMGGYVDTIMRGEIRDRVTQTIANSPSARQMDPEVRAKLIRDTIAAEEDRVGLNVPIAVRNFRYLSNALTLQLGRA
ncbi:MAG TPA: hypothetical protein VHO49_05595, partial [Anaerolineales bacterium]|nr:hypothetical protein [Anaerolineales bacterium]